MNPEYWNADRFIDATGKGLPQPPHAMSLASDDPSKIERWLSVNMSSRLRRLAVCVPDALETEAPSHLRMILDACWNALDNAKVSETTIVMRSKEQAENFVRHTATPPVTVDMDNPVAGPICIVGAGPSLDVPGDLDALRAWAKRGGTVCAVNTAVPALVRAGVQISFVVCVESLDVSGAIAATPEGVPVCLDVCAHRQNWAAAGERAVAIASDQPGIAELCAEAQIFPLPFGGSATTLAVSLATTLGYGPIILAGQDHAYPTNRPYAEHSAFGDLFTAINGDRATFAGKSKDMPDHDLVPVLAWRKRGQVQSTAVFGVYLRWLSRAAKARKIINTSTLGARIPNTVEVELSGALAAYSPKRTTLPTKQALPITSLPAQLDRARDALAIGGAVAATLECPLLNCWGVPAMLRKKHGEAVDVDEAVGDAIAWIEGTLA